MNNFNTQKPVVLVFAGHDPSGGAGIQADIESITSNGCHAATVITVLTQQNTQTMQGYRPQNIQDFKQQTQLILEDIDIQAIKIGMIGDQQLLDAIVYLIKKCKSKPVIFDPIISTGTGTEISNGELRNGFIEKLLPLTTLITPNSIEARALANHDGSLEDAANKLLTTGCENILITGTHEDTEQVINTLYSIDKTPLNFECPRLPGEYHGSGCTLSSSIAAHIALGHDVKDAVDKALHYTWECLNHSMTLRSGQHLPDRISWRLKDKP